MLYVQKKGGEIIGLYAKQQHGKKLKKIAEDDPAVIAFRGRNNGSKRDIERKIQAEITLIAIASLKAKGELPIDFGD